MLEQSLGSTNFALLMATLAVGTNLLFLALAFLGYLVIGSGVRTYVCICGLYMCIGSYSPHSFHAGCLLSHAPSPSVLNLGVHVAPTHQLIFPSFIIHTRAPPMTDRPFS